MEEKRMNAGVMRMGGRRRQKDWTGRTKEEDRKRRNGESGDRGDRIQRRVRKQGR